ncbi:MAG: hypothetical protein ACI8P9_005363 [Parasphingorhabdus sp.]|jgi:hypothetical protein
MLDFLLQRSTVISLAVLGGILSIAASGLAVRGLVSPNTIKLINKASYACMAISVVLFIGAGLIRLQGG